MPRHLTGVTAVAYVARLAGASVGGGTHAVQTAATQGQALRLGAVRRISCAADVDHSLPDLRLEHIAHRVSRPERAVACAALN